MKSLNILFNLLSVFLFFSIGFSQVLEDSLPEPDFNDYGAVVDSMPQPLNMEEIRLLIGYPILMRDAGIEGMVVVRILVDTNGNPVKHKFIKKVHPGLVEAIEPHVNKLRFSPAIQEGQKMMFWVNMPFKFKLVGRKKKKRKKN